jgi:hypothetical protein
MLRIVWLVFYLFAHEEAPPQKTNVDFKRDVQPILEKHCTPCHFSGGRMHHELPFDDPATISKLNTRLLSRIKDERERTMIGEFISLRE